MEIIKLCHPFTLDGQEITELEMRTPTLRDHIFIKTKFGSESERKKRESGSGYYDEEDRNLQMLARLIDKDIEFLYQLSLADVGKLSQSFEVLTNPSTGSQK